MALEKLLFLLAGIYSFAFMLTPKAYFVSSFGFRAEDPVGPAILMLLVLYALRKPNLSVRAGAYGILAYLAYLLGVTLVNEIFVLQKVETMVLYVKELSFIGYGMAVYIAARQWERGLLRLLFIMSVPVILFGAFQVMTTPLGMYGVSPPGHETSPASSGLIYFTCFLIAYLSGRFYGFTPLRFVATAVSFILVVLSGSKLSTLGIVVFVAFEIRTFAVSHGGLKTLILLGVLLLVMGVFGLVVQDLIAADTDKQTNWDALSRYQAFMDPFTTLANRGIWWKLQWVDDWLRLLIGNGLSAGHVGANGSFSFAMAMDNQFLYLLVVLGSIGTTLFFIMLYLMKYNFDQQTRPIYYSLVFSFLAMGLGAEVFQLSVSGSVFWMMVGLLAARTQNRPAMASTVRAPGPVPPASIARQPVARPG